MFLPNSGPSAGTIDNCSASPGRRVSFDFSIGGNDPEKMKKSLTDCLGKDPLVLMDPLWA